jgi:hypothetical protein
MGQGLRLALQYFLCHLRDGLVFCTLFSSRSDFSHQSAVGVARPAQAPSPISSNSCAKRAACARPPEPRRGPGTRGCPTIR